MTPDTAVESGPEGQQEVASTNPEWDAMNGLLRQVLTVSKEEYERREDEYKKTRQSKTRGQT